MLLTCVSPDFVRGILNIGDFVINLVTFFGFFRQDLSCSPRWPRPHSVAQAGLPTPNPVLPLMEMLKVGYVCYIYFSIYCGA